jgi:hypothetical protein
MVIGLVTGNLALWVGITAAAGIVLGFILRTRTLRNRQRNLLERARQAGGKPLSPAASSGSNMESAA